MLDLLTYENRLVVRTAAAYRVAHLLMRWQLRPEQLKPNFWITEQKDREAAASGDCRNRCCRSAAPARGGMDVSGAMNATK